jgi:hypothetical protein
MIAERFRSEVSELIQQELAFLLELGFAFDGVSTEAYGGFGDTLVGRFMSHSTNRVVLVRYCAEPRLFPEHVFTSISLLVPESEDPDDYVSTGSMMVWSTDFLEAGGRFMERFREHLRATKTALSKDFLNVLLGHEWKSDVIDWGNLK